MTANRWLAYIISSFLINIVGLNLLISVISDNYTKVTSKINSIDYKARLEQILKIEKSIQQIDRDRKHNYSREYLHIIKYAKDEVSEDPQTVRLNEMQTEITNLKT